jgi:hypothetical protein
MSRAIVCSSSGSQNCVLQHLVCHFLWVAVQCTGWERTYQMLLSTILTSWRWAYYCSKHVEVSNVIHILQNKGIVHQVGNKNKFIRWCTVRKTSNYTTSMLDKLATGFRMKCKTWTKSNCTICSTVTSSDAQDILVCTKTQCMVVFYDFELLYQNMQLKYLPL